MFGGVVGSVFGLGLLGVWVFGVGVRAFGFRFEFGRVVPAALLAAGVWALRALLPPMPLIASLGVGIALFLAYVALMWGLGWIRREEREALLAWLRARWRPGTGGPAPEAS
jgi:hypothetical protein